LFTVKFCFCLRSFLCVVRHKLCRRNRALRSGTTIWRPCSAHLGLGLDRVFNHVGWACNERAFFQIPRVWGAVLLVIHVGWTVRALCKLACGLGQSAGSGKVLSCCSVSSCNQSLEVISYCAGCLCQWQYIHICAVFCCRIISLQWLFYCDRLLPKQWDGKTMRAFVCARTISSMTSSLSCDAFLG